MGQWDKTTPGYKTKTIKSEGITVIIHRPELPSELYARRQQEVIHVLASAKGGRTA